MKNFSFFITERYCGLRLDNFISCKIDSCSRSKASFLIKKNFVCVNGLFKKPSYNIKDGDFIVGFLWNKNFNKFDLISSSSSLQVVYEDSDIFVVNKEAGVIVHPYPGYLYDTIVNLIIRRNPNLKSIFLKKHRLGVVHRLDIKTTGILIFVKNVISLKNILFQFRNRQVVKKYLAIVHNFPYRDEGKINFSIGRNFIKRIMSVNGRNSRDAVTYWRVIEKFGEIASFIEFNIVTGRTHQIRVHCSYIGNEIIGDCTYGRKRINDVFLNGEDLKVKIKRQMLHSQRIEFRHPINGKCIYFESKLPEDMTKLLNILRNKFNK